LFAVGAGTISIAAACGGKAADDGTPEVGDDAGQDPGHDAAQDANTNDAGVVAHYGGPPLRDANVEDSPVQVQDSAADSDVDDTGGAIVMYGLPIFDAGNG
jgi:hypothetical protein